ncbi:MAG TPA: hypothetical protein VHW95_10725 [Steroidobacteraceae bacterium]|nr:hypothetical protein [Steroidobacteraceae bacterium]
MLAGMIFAGPSVQAGDLKTPYPSMLPLDQYLTDPASWGANLHGSPIVLDPSELPEPETIFMVPLGTWSDGSPSAP